MRIHTLLPVWLVAMACSVTPLFGQLHIGGTLGANFASINVDPEPSSEEYTGRVGIGIGVVVDLELAEVIDLHSGIVYLAKGATVEENNEEVKFKVDYIELPLFVRYAFGGSGTVNPYVMAGPSIGFLASAMVEDEAGNEFDIKDEIAGIDVSVGVGAGVKAERGNMTLFGEVRYLIGLTNINEEADESEVNNRGLFVAIGATVPVGN